MQNLHFACFGGCINKQLNAHRFGPEYFAEDKLHFIPLVHRELGAMLTELVVKNLKGKTLEQKSA